VFLAGENSAQTVFVSRLIDLCRELGRMYRTERRTARSVTRLDPGGMRTGDVFAHRHEDAKHPDGPLPSFG